MSMLNELGQEEVCVDSTRNDKASSLVARCVLSRSGNSLVEVSYRRVNMPIDCFVTLKINLRPANWHLDSRFPQFHSLFYVVDRFINACSQSRQERRSTARGFFNFHNAKWQICQRSFHFHQQAVSGWPTDSTNLFYLYAKERLKSSQAIVGSVTKAFKHAACQIL